MGAGAFGAGLEPAGSDPVLAPSSVVVPPDQNAPVYFLETKGYKQLPDGTFVTADDVDQAVQLALGIRLGTIGSAKDVGNELLDIGRVPPAQVPAAVQDRVTTALADLIKAGLVIVYGIDIQEPIRGSREVFVSYWNTRRQGSKPDTVKAVV